MAVKELDARIRLKRDTSANWTANNPVLLYGEIVIVETANGEIRTKTGDGTKTYTQLPFDDEGIYNALNQKCDASVAMTATLYADKWNDKQQVVTVTGLGANQNGIASLPQNCSDSEYEAVCAAGLMVTKQSAGNITISANGDVPEIDIPILILLLG